MGTKVSVGTVVEIHSPKPASAPARLGFRVKGLAYRVEFQIGGFCCGAAPSPQLAVCAVEQGTPWWG